MDFKCGLNKGSLSQPRESRYDFSFKGLIKGVDMISPFMGWLKGDIVPPKKTD